MPRLSAEELAGRSRGLGSTDIVEANGLAPWKGAGPMRLYCEKVGILTPDDEGERDDERESWLEWGHTMEPVIANWYEREKGVQLMLGGQVRSEDFPFLWATLDRKVIGEPRIVEVKNVGSPQLYRHWDTSSEDGIPPYVRAQCAVAMRYARVAECDVVASIGGRPPHVWRVFYDAELAELLETRAIHLWDRIVQRKAPELDSTSASRAYLLARYPENRERVMREADSRENIIGALRAQAAFEEKRHAREKDRLSNELLAAVGESDGLQGDTWKMTWKLNAAGKRVPRFTTDGLGDEPEKKK